MAGRDKYSKLRDKELAGILREIDALYAELSNTIGFIGASSASSVDKEKPFHLSDYPTIKTRTDNALLRLAKKLDLAIVNGVRSGWALANKKNDELCRVVFGDRLGSLNEAQRRRYFNNNDRALGAFLTRKDAGLSLSRKVWDYTKATEGEIESTLELGIKTGEDAASMARDLREYLKFPDKLFRRVRDNEGKLHLSKNASAFHPGQGVYRSSYKNARRLAATENNIAYATADNLRYAQLDFIVGYRVNLSQNHTCLDDKGVPQPFHDICDELAGDYPKWFKFTGWHPQCRCFTTTILKTPEEVMRDADGIDRGSVNEVKSMPPQWYAWVDENRERIEQSEERGTLPYFLRDNRWAWTDTERPKAALERADERHAARTPEQIADIKARWLERELAYDDARRVLRLADSIPGLDKYFTERVASKSLENLRYRYNTGDFKSYSDLRRSTETALAIIKDIRDYDLNLLVNPLDVLRKWGVEKALEIQANVRRTMSKYEKESLEEKAKRYRYEARWIEEHRKDTIPTWKEAQDAYLKAAKDLEWKIEWQDLTDRLAEIEHNPDANPVLIERARQFLGKDKAKAEEAIKNAEENLRITQAQRKFNYYLAEHPKLLETFADEMELALDAEEAENVLRKAKVFVDAWDDTYSRASSLSGRIPEALWDEIQEAVKADDYPALDRLVKRGELYVSVNIMRDRIRVILKDYGALIENWDAGLHAALQDDLLGGTADTAEQMNAHLTEANNIIRDYDDTLDEFMDDYQDYDTKGKTYLALVDRAREAATEYDLRRLKSNIADLRAEKQRLEREKKYAEERAAEWRAMASYVRAIKALGSEDVELGAAIDSFEFEKSTGISIKRGRDMYNIIRERARELGLSTGNRKTLDDLKRELGDKMPKTLEKLEATYASYAKSSLYGADAKANAEELEAVMLEWLSRQDLGMNVPEYNMEKVLESWFKNTFEVGTSGGYDGPAGDLSVEQGGIPTHHARLKFSHKRFLNGESWESEHQLKRKEYEKYGNLMNPDILSSLLHNHGSSYGRVQVRFKKDRVIATWTPNDSLGGDVQPSLVTDPKAYSFDEIAKHRLPLGMGDDPSFDKLFSKTMRSYCELQFHGDLTPECVESLAYPYDLKDPRHAEDLRVALRWKREVGVKVYYIDSEGNLAEL